MKNLKNLIEMIEIQEELDNLIQESIGELTVREYQQLLEVESTSFQKGGNVAQTLAAGLPAGVGGYISRKRQEAKMIDKLEKMKNPTDDDVEDLKRQGRKKTRNVERILSTLTGAAPGLVLAAKLAHDKRKMGVIERMRDGKRYDDAIKSALALSGIGAAGNLAATSLVHGGGAIARDTIANASEKDYNRRVLQHIKNKKQNR